MKKTKKEEIDFPGFESFYSFNPLDYGFIMYPELLESYWYLLSGSEQKVLDFIVRQTIGWHKSSDWIAWSQFTDGLGGKSRNKGTGLSKSQVRRAAASLEEKGFITIERNKNRPCKFNLVLEYVPPGIDWDDEDVKRIFTRDIQKE